MLSRGVKTALFCLLLPFQFLFGKEFEVTVTERQLCDLEMLMSGSFAPLTGFLDEENYLSVVETMRLKGGALCPLPIVFDISEELAGKLKWGDRLQLLDINAQLLATFVVDSWWKPNKEKEALQLFGTLDETHPGVTILMQEMKPYYVSGEIEFVSSPAHFSFDDLRKGPEEMRSYFAGRGEGKVIAFHLSNRVDRPHFFLTEKVAEKEGGLLWLSPLVGVTAPGDIDPFTRVACYRKLLPHYSEGAAALSVLPLAVRMAGPREALWHAMIRKNYGATHFIMERKDQAQELLKKHAKEIGIEVIAAPEILYLEQEQAYVEEGNAPKGAQGLKSSEAALRQMLKKGDPIPSWYTFPEVMEVLQKAFPPRSEKGLCLFFTGLPGSGKTTLANGLIECLSEQSFHSVSHLDGNLLRECMGGDLGFSRQDRAKNIRRAGYIASEIVKHKGIVICSFIAPYEMDREWVKNLIEKNGGEYIEVYLATPIETCEERKPFLYEKARKGIIKEFTGIDDPYEIPLHPSISVDATDLTPEQAVEKVLSYLEAEGYRKELN